MVFSLEKKKNRKADFILYGDDEILLIPDIRNELLLREASPIKKKRKNKLKKNKCSFFLLIFNYLL